MKSQSTNQRINYLLHLADTTLILSQRNAEWCGHGPILEQDIALTNISLDLLGQSRNFYQYAAKLINENIKFSDSKAPPAEVPEQNEGKERSSGGATEDSLAYLRKEREFKNLLLAELPNGDWGQTILRQYYYSQFQYLLFEQLQDDKDEQLAAIAAKSIKETTYHVRWSSEWVIRLGDGTAESHDRMLHAVDELWRYTGEMFEAAEYEKFLNIDFEKIKKDWHEKVNAIMLEATLHPTGGKESVYMQTGGKEGKHTEQLGFILTDLQYMQRTYPGAAW